MLLGRTERTDFRNLRVAAEQCKQLRAERSRGMAQFVENALRSAGGFIMTLQALHALSHRRIRAGIDIGILPIDSTRKKTG